MNIEFIAVGDLKPYDRNAKKHDAKQIKNVAESIKQFGFAQPIVIDKDNNVIIGHCRLLASKKLKLETVPCVKMESLDDDQVQKLRLLDNKLNESDWDFDLLSEDIPALDFSDFDIDWNLPDVLDDDADEDDFDGEVPEEPKSKHGDVYILGRHRLMCGSSTNPDDIDLLMNGNTPELIYTDPPYGMNAVSKSGVLSETYKTDIMNDDDNTVAIDAFNLSMQMFKDAKAVWWGANYYTECLPSSECWIVWDKNNGSSDQTDCELAWANFRSVVRQFTMASEKKNRVHPTQKPVKLFSEIIKKFDKENQFKNVLDLFGGSGSTLIACEQMNRTCYVMELDPKFVDVIIERWEKFTGKKAELING